MTTATADVDSGSEIPPPGRTAGVDPDESALDSVPGLIDAHGGHAVVTAEFETLPSDWGAYAGKTNGKELRLETDRPLEDIAKFANAGGRISRLQVDRPDLETVFLALTGRSLRD